MEIWPAIDIRGGKCVRLIQGDYAREKVYGENPADMALRWVGDGARRLHVVDLDGARSGGTLNRDAVAEIVRQVKVPVQLGGGIRDAETIASYFDAGVARLVVGTKALQDPAWLEAMALQYPGRIVIGIDARGGMVAVEGWLKTSEMPAVELAAKFAHLPLAGLVYTDIARDGMLSGPNVEALRAMVAAVPMPVIASGGVTTAADVADVAALGAAGCIIGRTLYEGQLTLADALRAAGEGAG